MARYWRPFDEAVEHGTSLKMFATPGRTWFTALHCASLAVPLVLVLACSRAALLGQGSSCTSPLDCEPGLICAPVAASGVANGRRECSSDLSGTGGQPPGPGPADTGPRELDSATSDAAPEPVPADATVDAAQDSGAPDSGADSGIQDASDSG
jgi:hypothetical protein